MRKYISLSKTILTLTAFAGVLSFVGCVSKPPKSGHSYYLMKEMNSSQHWRTRTTEIASYVKNSIPIDQKEISIESSLYTTQFSDGMELMLPKALINRGIKINPDSRYKLTIEEERYMTDKEQEPVGLLAGALSLLTDGIGGTKTHINKDNVELVLSLAMYKDGEMYAGKNLIYYSEGATNIEQNSFHTRKPKNIE